MNLYNENDPKAAAWLRELIAEGLIPDGTVDERSICDLTPQDLDGFNQCHFFAGIAGWPYALRLAGWPDDRPVWTGSCPCQPLSCAGKRKGHADERHLWPAFYRLIAERKPATVFGEQVASAIGREWFAGVRADLEDLGYACGAADLCAASLGAPHIRQRLFWVADAGHERAGRPATPGQEESWRALGDVAGRGECGGLEHPASDGREQRRAESSGRCAAERCGEGGVADTDCGISSDGGLQRGGQHGQQPQDGRAGGHWSNYVWLPCADGKARRIEPGLEPLAHGIPARVVRLRGYGNAIVPQAAAELVKAFVEI